MSIINKLSFNVRQTAKKVLPQWLQDALRQPGRAADSRRRADAVSRSRLVTRDNLVTDLRAAGIAVGDVMMVHSSLSRIGNVEGGAKTAIGALIESVGEEGTVIMPCYNSAQKVFNDQKQKRYPDLRTSRSEVGKITEVFRTYPGVLRSSHPFSSSCAIGHQAAYVTSGHESSPYVCHHDSPVGRTVELGGKVVGIGVSIAQGLGVAHYLEDTWDEFPLKVHDKAIEISYVDCQGKTVTRPIIRFNPALARTRVDYPEGEWILNKLTTHFESIGLLKCFRFGEAESWIMNGQHLHKELKRLASKDITMYLTPERLTDQNRDSSTW